MVDRNLPFGSKPYVASEFGPLPSPHTSDRVFTSNISVFPPAEETIPEYIDAILVLTDPESTFDCNSEDTGSMDPTKQSMLDYGYMDDIDEFESVEEEQEIYSLPLSSLVSESPESSYRMSGLSLMDNPSAGIDFGAQESKGTSVLLESESLIASEPGLRNTRSISRTLLDQANPYCLMRAPSSSFELDHALHAVAKSQCFMVHLACTSNRRSFMLPGKDLS